MSRRDRAGRSVRRAVAPSRPRARRQVSAGGVIVRESSSGWDVCLIARATDRGLVWGLPKGHVEPGEQLEQTALREVREETGLTGEIVRKLGAITYVFSARPYSDTSKTSAPVRFVKTVHFYLLRYRDGRTSDHDDEVEQAEWFNTDEATRKLAYDNERRILRKALAVLNEQARAS